MTRILRFVLIALFGSVLVCCSSYPPGITVLSIAENGVKGTFIQQQSNPSSGTVIFLHGSGGPMSADILIPLANHGIDVLMLDYFGRSGLAETLESIPLEYVEQAVEWVREGNAGAPVILLGQSRGAELALMYSCYVNNVDGVVAYSPSGIHIAEAVQYQSGEARSPSWTLNGHLLPFAEIEALPEEGGTYTYKDWFQPILDDSIQFERARIPIEQSHCPILLMSGESDQIWPSAEMVNRMLQSASISSQERITSIRYEKAGHQFLWFQDATPESFSSQQSFWLRWERYRFPFGGTKEGNQMAMINSRDQTFRFIDRILRSESSH